jgi:hypothetical protein
MPYAPWASIKGTHYYWNQVVGDNINGNILGVEIELSPSTTFEFGQINSNTTERQSYGKLSIKLPFNDNDKITLFVLDDVPFRAEANMSLELLAMVDRSNKIKIERIGSHGSFSGSDAFSSVDKFNNKVYLTVTSSETGRIWLDRNLGASTACTSSSADSNCYGDLYQWGRVTDGHELRTSSTTTTLASTITPGANTFITNSSSPYDWTTVDNNGDNRTITWANDICPPGFSVPTIAELMADANIIIELNSILKMPMFGWRNSNDGLFNDQGGGYLWSRSPSVDGSNNSQFAHFTIGSPQASSNNTYRAHGLGIRCIKG